MIYDVMITRLGLSALFELQGPADTVAAWAGDALPALPDTANTYVAAGAHQLCWLGAESWLLRAPIADEASLIGALQPAEAPDSVSIICVSDLLAFWSISGADADQIINIAGPLDVHPRAFPRNGATWTDAFGQRALIMRAEGGFELATDRSYAPMISEYLSTITA